MSVLPDMVRLPWERLAACVEDPELWFPPGFQSDQNRLQAQQAAAVCTLRCPVAAQCLALALHREWGRDHMRRDGVWGGLTPRRRSTLEKNLRRDGLTRDVLAEWIDRHAEAVA